MLVSFLQFLFQALRTPSKKCHFVEVMQNILNQDELNFLLRGQKPAAEGGRSAQPGPETEAPSLRRKHSVPQTPPRPPERECEAGRKFSLMPGAIP